MKRVSKYCRKCRKVVDLTEEEKCPSCGRELRVKKLADAPLGRVRGGTPLFYGRRG
jgi:rRNA maturation endonuclease Nob1